MDVFPKKYKNRILEIVADNLCLVQLVSISEDQYPEARTVLLRFLDKRKSLFVATNMTYPKWTQVNAHPFVTVSTYLQDHQLAIRVKAVAKCFDNESEFAKQAWNSMPALDCQKYSDMAGEHQSEVSPIYGCIELHPHSWIIDETGEDGWICRRSIFEKKDNDWREVLSREM